MVVLTPVDGGGGGGGRYVLSGALNGVTKLVVCCWLYCCECSVASSLRVCGVPIDVVGGGRAGGIAAGVEC